MSEQRNVLLQEFAEASVAAAAGARSNATDGATGPPIPTGSLSLPSILNREKYVTPYPTPDSNLVFVVYGLFGVILYYLFRALNTGLARFVLQDDVVVLTSENQCQQFCSKLVEQRPHLVMHASTHSYSKNTLHRSAKISKSSCLAFSAFEDVSVLPRNLGKHPFVFLEVQKGAVQVEDACTWA